VQSVENWSAILPQQSVKDGPNARFAALIVGAALVVSGGLIYAALGDWVLLSLFAAGLIGIAAILALFRHFYPPVIEAEWAMPDWSVTHAATEHDSIAIAITDQAGRLTCANSRFVTLFGAKKAPPNIPLHNNGTDYLAEAGREAWRDGRGFADRLTANGVTYEAQVSRIGRGQEFLMWRIAPVVQTDLLAEANRLLAGKPGRALAKSGVMAVLIGPEGRIRAANSAFSERASGEENSNISGRDFAQFLRADEKNRIYFEREGRRGSPLRLLHIPLIDPAVEADEVAKAKAPALIVILDQDNSAIDRTSALGYVQTLLSLLPIGLAMTDRDGRFLFANAAFARASNISEEDMPPYPGDLVVGEDKGALADAVRRRASGQTQTGDVTIRLKSQPDEPVALSIASVRGMGDAAVLLSLKDSSEEAKLKRQVAQASKMQAVGQLAGGVAHDFNNVLTAIIGHCDLMLMRHSPGDSDYDDIQQIKSNSNRAAGLTRQLLAFSRQQTLRPQVLQLPDIVAEVSNLLQRLLGEKITLEINHDRDLGPIRADPGQLEQVIVNLAVNARDAMLSGKKTKGTLKISTRRVTASDVRAMGSEILPPEDYSALLVEDDGMGMPPDVQAKIFEPFFTTKEIGKGTGLGLSTVYGIVKQSGGYIFVDSVLGKSTKFTIYFPVYRGSLGEAIPAKKAPPPKHDEQWGNATLLLVEDEDMVRAVAERALTRQGYTVITASDGEEGLARFEDSGPFDLVVSDVVMPNMDGPAMASQLRQRAPDLPILFMSGYAEEQLRQTISLDQVHFLPKPFSVAQIVDAVRSAIAQ
jgi:two-component system cell cycle sensor histidine kinase/response regulator CckA